MQSSKNLNQKVGVLGGGQLGRMLYQAAIPYDISLSFMDSSRWSPVGQVATQYTEGDIRGLHDVLEFGKELDVLTIEIERVNVEAMAELERQGVAVYPQPSLVGMIQDKGLQKDFYSAKGFPTSAYHHYETLADLRADIAAQKVSFPFVQKIKVGGYDGRGVKVIRSEEDLKQAFDTHFIIEDKVSIRKEIAVIACRSVSGETVTYDPVEMVFDPDENILLYQQAPANISAPLAIEARKLAADLAAEMGIVGLLAVEMFVNAEGKLLINEVAPRPHNSGHHTIETCVTSQYENHLRAIMDLPLGSTELLESSILMNLLGAATASGTPEYQGLDVIMATPGAHMHLYGKKEVRPFRKMGHLTLAGTDKAQLLESYRQVSDSFSIV